MALSLFGRIFGLSADTFRYIAASLIAIFGLVMIFPKLEQMTFARLGTITSRFVPKSAQDSGLLGGFILGASLGLVWTPCAGPVLGVILTLVATKQNLFEAASLLVAYAIGAGVPMLLIAYGGSAAMTRARSFSAHAETVQRIFGVLVLCVSIALFTGLDRSFEQWLIATAPWLFLNLQINL